MSTITDRLARIMEAADAIADQLATMRTTLSDAQWDRLADSAEVGELLSLALDLEHELSE